jgi:hypothetical protein
VKYTLFAVIIHVGKCGFYFQSDKKEIGRYFFFFMLGGTLKTSSPPIARVTFHGLAFCLRQLTNLQFNGYQVTIQSSSSTYTMS